MRISANASRSFSIDRSLGVSIFSHLRAKTRPSRLDGCNFAAIDNHTPGSRIRTRRPRSFLLFAFRAPSPRSLGLCVRASHLLPTVLHPTFLDEPIHVLTLRVSPTVITTSFARVVHILSLCGTPNSVCVFRSREQSRKFRSLLLTKAALSARSRYELTSDPCRLPFQALLRRVASFNSMRQVTLDITGSLAQDIVVISPTQLLVSSSGDRPPSRLASVRSSS